MYWKNAVIAALAATIGVVGVFTYFQGFSLKLLLVAGALDLAGLLALSYVISSNRKRNG